MYAPPVDDGRAAVLFKLGVAYVYGVDVVLHWANATHFLKLAAERGHTLA
jgi:TPR repeat protein